jgi:ribosomal protein uL24
MKSDTERKKYYTEQLHKKKNRLHVHLSKDLRGKLKTKKRAILVRKEDKVKIMRGPGMGKEARVVRVSTLNRKVYVEGVVSKNRKGKENVLALEPSNLLLIVLEPTKERKEIFREEAFRKPEPKPEAKPAPAEAKKEPAAAAAPEHKHEGAAHEHEHAHEHSEAEHKHEGATHTQEHKPAAETKPPAHTAVKPSTR